VESRPGTPIWKRGKSLDERIPLLLGATTLAKDLLLNRLEIPVAGPGFIHIGTSDRGFDEAWSKEMTSERKEIVFRGGVQRTGLAEDLHQPTQRCMGFVLYDLDINRIDEAAI